METKYCPNCMRVLKNGAGYRLCPNCGFDLAANPQPQNALPWGTVLHDRYRIGRVLGQGGFGITYVGFDTNLQCRVAIKEYYPQGVVFRDASQSHSLTWSTSQKESGCESFLREARKMARIGNIPGIVRVIDTFTENDTSYIIMDYLEGVTLRQYITTNGTMSFEKCLDMLRPLCSSIDRIHQKGMFHRDISPDNIMVDGEGGVWLLDFGAAKDIEVSTGTESSVVVAKKGFSPSEQYSGRNIGAWTDVYAMCATMYFCVCGRPLPDVNERVQDESIPWNAAQVPDGVRAVFRQGLSIKYSDRIQSISELVDRLDDGEAGGSGNLRKDSGGNTGDRRTGNETEVVTDPGGDGGYSVVIDPFAEETSKQKRKSLIIKTSVAAAAVLLLIGAAVFAFSQFGTGGTADEGPEESDAAESEAVESTDAVDEGSEQAETYVTDRSYTDSTGTTFSYTGEWAEDKPNGSGTAVLTNGNKYMGTWKNGRQDGSGTMTYADGDRYEGQWKDGKRSGTGTYTWADGGRYEGQWKDDDRNGTASMTYASGNKYVGEFKDNKRDGTGTMTYASGDKYEGEWKNGEKNGTGIWTWATGEKYVGEFKGGKRDGTGIFTFSTGYKYEGKWTDDLMNGQGVLYDADGLVVVSGTWKNGEWVSD